MLLTNLSKSSEVCGVKETPCVKPGKNSIFLKNCKTIISVIVQVENVEFF